MTKNTNNSDMTAGAVMWLIIGVLFLLGLLFGNNGGGSSSGGGSSASSGSANYRYAKERFRQEGLSDSEAAEAASAVIKFHEAQKAQRGY